MGGAAVPRVGVAAHIFCPSFRRIAMVQRANAPGQGLWSVPGGKLELGETLSAAACREALEETGLVCRALNDTPAQSCVTESITPGPNGDMLFHYVLVHVPCALEGGGKELPAIIAADDASDAAWVELDDLSSRADLVEGLLGAVEECLATARAAARA